jgi:hypothetical protein
VLQVVASLHSLLTDSTAPAGIRWLRSSTRSSWLSASAADGARVPSTKAASSCRVSAKRAGAAASAPVITSTPLRSSSRRLRGSMQAEGSECVVLQHSACLQRWSLASGLGAQERGDHRVDAVGMRHRRHMPNPRHQLQRGLRQQALQLGQLVVRGRGGCSPPSRRTGMVRLPSSAGDQTSAKMASVHWRIGRIDSATGPRRASGAAAQLPGPIRKSMKTSAAA